MDCCIHCNNRNVLRAAFLKDKNLLKKCFNATEDISTLCDTYSAECPYTVFDVVIENEDKAMFSDLVRHLTDSKLNMRKAFKPPHKLSYIETGASTEFTHGGIRTRALNMTRGNKLGNNAFLDDAKIINNIFSWVNHFITFLMKNPKTDPKIGK